MRWPWEWGRRPDAADPGDSAGDPRSGAAGSEPVPAPNSTRSSGSAAWASLPSIQRSVDVSGPAVAPPDAFRAALATHQNPSFLAPLGHLVDADGPSGVVGGLTDVAAGRPVTHADGPELRV